MPIQSFPAPQTQTPAANDSATNTTTTTTGTSGEGEERKSDTTSTSNSTVPGTNGLTTTAVAPNVVYGGYAVNPYLPMMMTPNQFGIIEPNLDHMHIWLNQMETPPTWVGEPDLPPGPFYVVKVSCVATGKGADDRSVGHIALVDWNRNTKANVFVKPSEPIVSYLEPLTSLTPELLDKYGYPLDKAVTIIRSELPSNAVLVGQNITMDLQWLGLRSGEDFRSFIDLRDLWRSWSPHYKSYTHYSLSHQTKCILGAAPTEKHSASMDAQTTMKLFQCYLWGRKYSMGFVHSKVAALQSTEIAPSFAKRHPTFEGVQMQSKKYKGVPYITAKPHRYRLPTNSAADTAKSTFDDPSAATKGGDNGDRGGGRGGNDTVTATAAVDISTAASTGNATQSESVNATTTTTTTATTTTTTSTPATATGTAPIDPPKSKDAAVIV